MQIQILLLLPWTRAKNALLREPFRISVVESQSRFDVVAAGQRNKAFLQCALEAVSCKM